MNFFLKNINSKGKIHKVFNFFGLRFKFFVGFENSFYINKYLQGIKPYKASSHKIWDVSSKERESILKLDWNEASIPPTPLVEIRIKTLIENCNFLNLYPQTHNDLLLNLLSNYVNLSKKYIQYFASSDSIHEYVCKMYIKENDKVLILGPSYDNFRLTAQANGGDIYFSEIGENFQFDKKKFYNDIKKIKPTFVYICSPNNPCGYVLEETYIEKLLKDFVGTMFLVDEAYYEFLQQTVQNLVLKYENILVTRTLSKAFALANLRFGYLIASKNNIQNISMIRNPKNINSFTQEAAIAVLSDIDYMQHYVDEVNIAKAYFYDAISKFEAIQIFPSAANFILMRFKTYGLKMRFKRYLENNNIFVRDLSQSSILYKCLRISIGTKKQMQQVISVINDFFNDEEKIENKKVTNKIAFFDFCDTLADFQTGNAYIYYVVKQKKIKCKYIKQRMLNNFYKRLNKNYSDKQDILGILKGCTKFELERYAFNYYVEQVKPNIISKVLQELEDLKEQGYKIYLASGGYDIYLKYFVEEYNLDGCFSTKLKFKNGIFTGKFDGLDCMGDNKVKIIKDYFINKPIETYETIAYTDSDSDLPLLTFCQKGVVVKKNNNLNWSDKYSFRKIIINSDEA